MVTRSGYRRHRSSWSAGPSAARLRAIEWAQRTAATSSVVYLDTETTGLNAEAEIVDLAVVAGDGTALINTLVRPSRPIPLVASSIHGIRDRDVADAPEWADVFPKLVDAIRDRVVVVYNAKFDAQMVRQCCGFARLVAPPLDWQCAMRAYAEFEAQPGWSGGFKPHKLELAARRFGITPGGHRALADAVVCRAVVQAMAVAETA